MAVVMVKGIYWSAFFLTWITVICQVHKGYALVEGTVIKVNATENHSISLQCRHGMDESGINAIVWEDDNAETVAQLTYNSNGNLNNVRDDLVGRVTIGFPDGDLFLSDVNRIDGGYFKCVVIHRGLRHDPKTWYHLNIHVPPEKLQIKCSGTTDGIPDEDCSIIKNNEIKGIQCEVVSNPVSNLVWNRKAPDCFPKAFGGTIIIGDELSKKSYGLRPVCKGTYCCQAHYEVDRTLQSETVCVDIGETDEGTTADSLTDKDNIWIFLIIIFVAIAAVIFILFVSCICFCICYRNRNRKYPCGLQYIPCISICQGKKGKKRNLSINTVVVNDNGVENSALTPFLGPNHVAPTRGNVFTFVVNEAQDNPNVNRVKVTQDADPHGDQSRTVEIYKNRESSALMPPDDQNIHVQPGLFRRALSNSDVSKIVYTETIDDGGRVKREIDIIKGYPAEEKEKVVDEDYLESAGGISLSPTGAMYSMNSMQRRKAKLPATASETDIRRPVLQRQLTIERGRDNSRNLIYQHSQSTDFDFDTLPRPSVDLEEVD